MKRILTGVLLAIAALMPAPFAAADDVKPVPGQYKGLMLGVDPTSGAISGYFQDDKVGTGTEDDPQFSCLFAFSGKVGEKKIVIWLLGEDQIMDGAATLDGAISFKPGGVILTLAKVQGGCQDMIRPGNTFERDLIAAHEWRAAAARYFSS